MQNPPRTLEEKWRINGQEIENYFSIAIFNNRHRRRSRTANYTIELNNMKKNLSNGSYESRLPVNSSATAYLLRKEKSVGWLVFNFRK